MIMSGYSPKFAATHSTLVRKKAKVQARIKELLIPIETAIQSKKIADKEEVLEVATEILRARFSDFDSEPTKEQLKSPALKTVKRTKGEKFSSSTLTLHSPLEAAEFIAKLGNWYDTNVYNDIKVLFVIGKGYKDAVDGISKEGNNESRTEEGSDEGAGQET